MGQSEEEAEATAEDENESGAPAASSSADSHDSIDGSMRKPGLCSRVQDLRYGLWFFLNEPQSSRWAKLYSYAMTAIILTSIFNFLIGSFPDDFCAWKPRYDGESDISPDARRQCSASRIEVQPVPIYIEMVCIFAFTGEYVGRLLTCGVVMPVGRFICNPMNMLDLLAIAPWYISELVVFVTQL